MKLSICRRDGIERITTCILDAIFVKSKMLDGKDEHFTVAHSCSWCLLKEINDTLKWFIGAESHQAD